MFVLCPHCQYLVTVDPRTGLPPDTCPSCGRSMLEEVEITVDAIADAAPSLEEVRAQTPAVDIEPVVEAPPEPEPQPEPEPEPAPQLSADAVIAAMAQKAPRKPRVSKPRAEKKKKAAPEPAPAPEPKPAPPPKPKGPSLGARIGAAFASLKPKAKPKPVVVEEEKKPDVKPVQSLRDRAAKRAAAKAQVEVVEVVEVVETPPVIERPPLELVPMEEKVVVIEPIETPTEIAELAPTPIEAALAADALVPPPPIEDTPAPHVEPEPAPLPPPIVKKAPVSRPKTTAPSFARTRGGLRGAMPTQWSSVAIIGGLTLLLALQLLLAQRDALAATARWRPTMNALCTVLRCTLPAWREPEAFTMLSRDVRPHPTAAGTLRIDASFRNDARWSQAWPRLVVSLSDIDGRVLGTRAFTAREYLDASALTQSTLAPGQTVALRLDVVEPAPSVVAFSFEFR